MAARSPRLDALRGIAVFGILLVNVWSFIYGNQHPRFGVLDATAGMAERSIVFLVAAFAEQKFYPIFAFLFGAGFALQTGGPCAPGAALDQVKQRYQRRIRCLLGFGLIHGMLLWYGDILTAYALTAFWLAGKAGLRMRALLSSLRNVLIVNVAVQVVLALGVSAAIHLDAVEIDAGLLSGRSDFAVYTQGGWLDIARLRLSDYTSNLVGGILFFPRLALLFLAGVFAVRLGWLTDPGRHRALWRRVLGVALVLGLPLNLWWGTVMLQMSVAPQAPAPWSGLALFLIDLAGPCLAAGYVALCMLGRGACFERLAQVLAPVGRMALTNYLAQTALCSVLLQGFGLGLGALLSHAQLLLLCLAIMLGQAGFSHWWLKRHAQGPMEALWRRYSG